MIVGTRALLINVASRAARPLSSAASTRPAFDGEQAALCESPSAPPRTQTRIVLAWIECPKFDHPSHTDQKMFEQHLHPDGPWKLMVDQVKAAMPSGREGTP